ncbi:MAG: hypothetical protein ACRD28_01455 [Acidobacteriaceae bacterium]
MRSILLLSGLTILALMAGCRSPMVEARVINSGATVLHNIEVDYPSASFGFSSLAPGATYVHRFKIEDSGRMKVEFFDSKEKSHSGKGPYVAEGQQGTITLTLDGSGRNQWAAHLQPKATTPASD